MSEMSDWSGEEERLNGGVRFADFVFFPATGELFRQEDRVVLGPKPIAILSLLLERPGRLVERAALHRAAWPTTVVEFDQGLNACIRQIRRALGEDAKAPRFIETIPRRGYRFIHSVHPTAAPAAEPRMRRVVALAGTALGLMVVVVIFVGAGLWGSRSHPAVPQVDFAVAPESPALVGLERQLERQVRAQLSQRNGSWSEGGPTESLYLTGTLSEAEGGALLRVLLVRARDGKSFGRGVSIRSANGRRLILGH